MVNANPQYGELKFNTRAAGWYSNRVGDREVTLKVTDKDGKTSLCNGFYREVGSAVLGAELDPDGEFEYEYARPDALITFFGWSGVLVGLEAWENTRKGPLTVFRHQLDEPVALTGTESLSIIGPMFGVLR